MSDSDTGTKLLQTREAQLERELDVLKSNLGKLTKIGMALSSSTDFDSLLTTVLTECRRLLNADSGSIYLHLDAREVRNANTAPEDDPLGNPKRTLLFKEAQNDSVVFPFKEMTMPVSKRSIAGYVAMTGEILNIPDLYNIPKEAPYQFNTAFDQNSGYRSKSMLTIPMFAHDGDVLGVISLLNCKRRFDRKLNSPEDVEKQVIAFDAVCEEIGQAVASQAAVAIENNKLVADIKKLFDSFVITSVKAIEARDPSTAGHSSRVARLSTGLAEAIHNCDWPRFKDITYDDVRMNCLRKAGLLHDFGKIGVREHVLCKEQKLYPHQLIAVIDRFRMIQKLERIRSLEDELHIVADPLIHDKDQRVRALRESFESFSAQVEEELAFLLERNKPTFLPEQDKKRIQEIAAKTFVNESGDAIHYLTEEEKNNFLILKGSLNDEERVEIESHVSKSYELLRKIPWTSEYDGMLDAIYYHHERENGTGYPKGLGRETIPMGAMIIHIADIFDALVANDRPYKPAMPLEKALHILELEAKDGHLDHDLVQLFIEAKVYNVIKSRLVHEKMDLEDGYI